MSASTAILATLAAGDAVLWRGQLHQAVASRPYQRRDGQASALLTWSARCRECREPFRYEMGARGWRPTRTRCDDCRAARRLRNRARPDARARGRANRGDRASPDRSDVAARSATDGR